MLKKTSEAPYTTKVNIPVANRNATSQPWLSGRYFYIVDIDLARETESALDPILVVDNNSDLKTRCCAYF